MFELSRFLLAVRKPYLRAGYHVYKIGCLLVRGISLPAAQLFVIAIENIFRCVVVCVVVWLCVCVCVCVCVPCGRLRLRLDVHLRPPAALRFL